MKNIKLEFSAEYASEVMSGIPNGNIDKTICGCGLTTVGLENSVHTIIAVPTIYLALNKSEQYPNERFDGGVLAVWGDTTADEINHYVRNTRVIKIMVTYDSLPKVTHLLYKCKLVIDESNELLSRTKLKPEVINRVFDIGKRFRDTVSLVSATPTPLKYMPDWIAELDQIKIEWKNTVKTKPILVPRTYPFKSLKDEFITPLIKSKSITVAGKTFSKAIIFINTISQIAIIKKDTGLNRSDCGIICGDSLRNDVKIMGISRYTVGEMPKILFVTSSGFCGIDLYDSEAMTIVVSNTGKDWQMIDMLTDLKQAVSRQRNKNNPNYGSFIYIYNQTLFEKSEEDLLNIIDGKYRKITKSINIYKRSIAEGDEEGFMKDEDFMAYTLFRDDCYIVNEQAFQADKYFLLEVRSQYTKGFDIKGSLNNSVEVAPVVLPSDTTYSRLVDYFNKHHENGVIDWGVYSTKTDWIALIESSYRLFNRTWKDSKYAKEMVENYGNIFSIIKLQASTKFSQGHRYTRSQVKKSLQPLYDEHGLQRKANHNDLWDIFTDVRNVVVNGERYVEIDKK